MQSSLVYLFGVKRRWKFVLDSLREKKSKEGKRACFFVEVVISSKFWIIVREWVTTFLSLWYFSLHVRRPNSRMNDCYCLSTIVCWTVAPVKITIRKLYNGHLSIVIPYFPCYQIVPIRVRTDELLKVKGRIIGKSETQTF